MTWAPAGASCGGHTAPAGHAVSAAAAAAAALPPVAATEAVGAEVEVEVGPVAVVEAATRCVAPVHATPWCFPPPEPSRPAARH